MEDASEAGVSFLTGITRRRWVAGLFVAVAIYDVVDGIVRSFERPVGPLERIISEILVGGVWFFVVAVAWLRTNLISSPRGIIIRNPFSRSRFYPWDSISQFVYQGRVFPTAAMVLHTGRVIRIASLNQGLCVRAREAEPSWEMRSAVAELDRMRLNAVGIAESNPTPTR